MLPRIALLLTICVVGTVSVEPDNVHLIFMNHLDVGFGGLHPTIAFVNNVINRYFTVYFPQAVTLSLQLEYSGYVERLVYTTHPWLVSLYINCPSNFVLSGIQLACPNATSMAGFKLAVQKGYITWHAGAMNLQPEMATAEIFDFSLRLSDELDAYFNINRKVKVMSQRDVPGMTQAVIPILVKNKIQAVSVGVNGVTSPPALPKLFNWVFKNDSVIGFWHPGGYPNNPGQLPIMPGGLSRKDCLVHSHLSHALCFAFRNDNSGPPKTIQEVLMYYEIARSQFPKAIVRGSTFGNFVAAVLPIKSYLPTVTNEIGDTWIEGVSSDPRKVAEMRAFMRLWSECLLSKKCSLKDSRIHDSGRLLLKTTEHTWGIDSVYDSHHWTNEQFNKVRNKQRFKDAVMSWVEQRSFNYLAHSALGSHPLYIAVAESWKALRPHWPKLTGYINASPLSNYHSTNGYEVEFSSSGYLEHLILPFSKVNWASKKQPMAQFIYQTLNQSDFDVFNKEYPYSKAFSLGIGKKNLNKHCDAISQVWDTKLAGLYRKPDNSSFLVHLKMADPVASKFYGAPTDIWTSYIFDASKSSPGVHIEVQWFNKTTTRLPEAMYVNMSPQPLPGGGHWYVHKMNQLIDPLNVLLNGSQTLHAIDKGVYYINGKGQGLEILSPDVALVTLLQASQAKPSVLPLCLKPIKDVSGVAFNLHNNVWDVNYVFWYPFIKEDCDHKVRFTVNLLT